MTFMGATIDCLGSRQTGDVTIRRTSALVPE